MSDKNTVEIQVWSGAEGPCIYINNYRICGPKPWGGSPIKTWQADLNDLLKHLPKLSPTPASKAPTEAAAPAPADLASAIEALKPFAEKAKLFASPRYDVLAGVHQKVTFTIRDLRRASAEIAKHQKEG